MAASRIRSALTGVLGLLGLVAAAAAPGSAQVSWDATEARVDRPALEQRLSLYERAAESPAYSPVLRGEAREQAELIRQRLEQGDFRAGDRLYISVEQFDEMTDTFAVAADQKVTIPNLGDVDLTGVLRSEAQSYLTQQIATIIREPRVRARSLVRVLIDGAVTRPGYYLVDSDMPVSDLMRQAGGQLAEARLDAARVERGADLVVSPDQFQQALRVGATVDHLGLRDGDRVLVPGSRTSWLTVARDVVYIIPAAVGLLALLL